MEFRIRSHLTILSAPTTSPQHSLPYLVFPLTLCTSRRVHRLLPTSKNSSNSDNGHGQSHWNKLTNGTARTSKFSSIFQVFYASIIAETIGNFTKKKPNTDPDDSDNDDNKFTPKASYEICESSADDNNKQTENVYSQLSEPKYPKLSLTIPTRPKKNKNKPLPEPNLPC